MSNEDDDLPGGFRQVGGVFMPMVLKFLDSGLLTKYIEGGWVATHSIDDNTVNAFHQPTGTRSTMLIHPGKGFNRSSFEFISSGVLRGDGNLLMEGAHQYLWFSWDGEGDPLQRYKDTRIPKAE